VIPLRRFDVANLNRNLFRITADLELSEAAFLGFTAGVQNSDYPDSLFGLQEWNTYTVGLDFSYALSARSSFNAWYEYSQNNRDQKGRQSSSSPSTSADFDWTAGLEDTFNTVGLSYLIHFKEGAWDWETDFIYADANGLEDLEGGPAIRPTGAVDLPNVDDTEHYSLKTGLNVKAFPRARIGIWYWFDKYTIDDFSENDIQTDLITVVGPTGSTSTPGVILLNARQPDYLYHTGWVGLIYSW
jgi:hypothetical protein